MEIQMYDAGNVISRIRVAAATSATREAIRRILNSRRGLPGSASSIDNGTVSFPALKNSSNRLKRNFHRPVFVYTPKGEIKDLPKGATPLDFAYRVHTDLGHRLYAGQVNGKLVPFNYTLKTAMSLKSYPPRAPGRPPSTWLNPNLGYVPPPIR